MDKKLVILLVLVGFLCGCGETDVENEGLGPGELKKWNDPNFEIISVGSYNYTDYGIYDVFILPPDKNDIKFAADASGWQPTPRNAESWWRPGARGANLAWDYRWATPKKFKVWWFRIVDTKAYKASSRKYDKYTMKETAPGAAWCEAEIEIKHPARRNKTSDLVIHYYPDGHIEADIVDSDNDIARVDIKKRSELPVLKGGACLKEVPNPYFGKKKPVAMY